MAKSSDSACLSDPNFAVICSFLDRYGEILGLPEVSCTNLQNWVEDTKHVSKILTDIHVRLLRRIKTNVSVDRWEKVLVKYCYTYSEVDAWEVERFGYKHSKLSTKIRVLKNLLESQFDYNPKFKDKINELSPDEMRFLPLGRDKNGLAYYYMLDKDINLRVYRECQDDIDAESWEIVCKDRAELFKLIRSLQGEVGITKDREKEESPDTTEENSKDCLVKDIEGKVLLKDVRIVLRDKKPLVKDIKVEPPDKDDTEEDTQSGATPEIKNGPLIIKTEQKDSDSEGKGDKEDSKERKEKLSKKVSKKKRKAKEVFHLESEHEKEHDECQDKERKERLELEKPSPGLTQGKEKSLDDLDNELESNIKSDGRDEDRNEKCKDGEVIQRKNTDKGKGKQSSDIDGQEHDRTFQSKHSDFKTDSEVKGKSAKGNGRDSEKKDKINSNFSQNKEKFNESAKIVTAKELGESLESKPDSKMSDKELQSKHKNYSVENTKGLTEVVKEELSKNLHSSDKENRKSGEKGVSVSNDPKDKTREKDVSVTSDPKYKSGEKDVLVSSDPKDKTGEKDVSVSSDPKDKTGEKDVSVSSELKDKTGEKDVSVSSESKDKKTVSKCEENIIRVRDQNGTHASHIVVSDPEEKETNQSNEANNSGNQNISNSLSSFKEGKGGNDSGKICDKDDGDSKTIGGTCKVNSNEADKRGKSDSVNMEEKSTCKEGVSEIKTSVDDENKVQYECNKDEASPSNVDLNKENLERTAQKGGSASLKSASVESFVCQSSDVTDADTSDAIDQSRDSNVEQSSQNQESNATLVCQKGETEESLLGSKCQEKAEEMSSDKKHRVKESEISVDGRKSKVHKSSRDEMKDKKTDMQKIVKVSSNSTCVKYEKNEGSKAKKVSSLKDISKDSAPNSKGSSKNLDVAFSKSSELSKEAIKNVNDSEKVAKEMENSVKCTHNGDDTHTTSKIQNESVKCVEANTKKENDKVSVNKEESKEQSTDIKLKNVGDNVEEPVKEELSRNNTEHNEPSNSLDDASKNSATSSPVISRRSLRTRSKANESQQDQTTAVTSVDKSTSIQGHENESSAVLKESKSEAAETGKSKNKRSRKECVDKTADSKKATEMEKEETGGTVDEAEKDAEKSKRIKKTNTEKEIISQEETSDKKTQEEQKAEELDNGEENIPMSTERGRGGSSGGQASGASGGRKRQNWVDESAEDSPVEPVSKKARGRNHVTSRGRGKRHQRQVASSSLESSSTSSDDDVPLSTLSKSARGRRASRGKVAAVRGRGGSKGVADMPTRKSSRPVKKKRFDSDEDSDSQTPVKGTKSKTASQKKEDEDEPKDEESAEETGCRRSARVRSLRARRKEKELSPELDLIDDLDDSSYIAEESDDDDYVLKKRKGKRRNKLKFQEELIPKGRNAQRQEALSKGKKKEEEDDTPCCKCRKSQHPEWILLCDKCDAGYHTACLRPPLMIIPDGDWFCPPCEHEFLIRKLQENLVTLDTMLKKHDRLIKRRERLAFVGISLDNILKEETKENIEPEEEEEEEEYDYSDKQSSMKFRFGGRSCRQHRNISYKFEEFDEMINTAIEDDMREPRPPRPPRPPKPPGISRGKDMANIFGPEHEDLEEKPQSISRKRKSKLTELDEEDFDDDSEDYEASEDIDSDATCEKDWESGEEEEVSDFSEEEFRPSRYATRRSNRRKKGWTRHDGFVDDDDDDCDILEKRGRRRTTRSSTQRRNACHDILSDEEEMSTDEETEDVSDYWSSSQESFMKKSLKVKKLDKGKSKKKKRKIMSSEDEREEEEEEDSANETTKKKTKDKKSLRKRNDDDSDYSESDYEERTYRRVSRRNINKRINYRIMLGSDSSSNSSKSSSEKTESEGEEVEKINTSKCKKRNVIESDSDGTDDYYEEEKKTKKEKDSAEESEPVSEAIDKDIVIPQKIKKLLDSDTEEEEEEEKEGVSDKGEGEEKEKGNVEKKENASEGTLAKTGEPSREDLKPAKSKSPEQTMGGNQDKQDSVVEEEKETDENVEEKRGQEEENMRKISTQVSSSSLSVNDDTGNENVKVIDKKEDRIFSSKKPEAPIGVVKPEVRQGVIVENRQGVESCTPGPMPGQGYPVNYRMGSPNQGMRDPSMSSPPMGSPPPHIRGQEQGFRQLSPSYSQSKGSMGGYMQPGFQTYSPQQQGPYTLSHSGPFPHGDPSRFYPQSSQGPVQQASYSPSASQPYMSHPNMGPHGPYPVPYGPNMSNQGHHSSPSNYQGHYGPQGPVGPSYGGYPQGPHGSTHHPQGFHSPPAQAHYQGPHPQGPYPLSQPQSPYPGSATGPYPYQHGNPKGVPHSQGPFPHPQSHSAPQHMSVMRPQMGPQGQQGMMSPNFPQQEKPFMQASFTEQGKTSTSKGTPEKGDGEKPPPKSAKGKSKKGEKKTVSSIQPLEPMRAPKRSGFMMDNILKPISTPEQGPFPPPAVQPEEGMDEIEDIVNYVANDEYFKEH